MAKRDDLQRTIRDAEKERRSEERKKAWEKRERKFWRTFLFTEEGKPKSGFGIYTFCLSFVFLAFYVLTFHLVTEYLTGPMEGWPVKLANLAQSLLAGLLGLALVWPVHRLSSDKRLALGGHLWLALYAAAVLFHPELIPVKLSLSIIAAKADVPFSTLTEVRDGVHMLAARCSDAKTRDRLAEEMKWYDDYLANGGVGRDANPTPGNKAGGLANIVEKAMGSIAKSGTSQIVEVLSPAEKPTKHGLIYAATPASDIVCGPSQVASGIGLQVFMTGRGTPYGLDISPVIKVCSRNEMKEHWFDLIDISAGDVATGEKTIADVGQEIFDMILDVASGIREPYSDQHGFHNDMCIFNPAPIT